jgi:penicillin-binding protein 2
MSAPYVHEEDAVGIDFRLLILPILVVFAFIAFLARLWYVQVFNADEAVREAAAIKSTSLNIPAPRGLILDRKGRILAGVNSQYVVTAVPRTIRKSEDKSILNRVAGILGQPLEKLEARLADGNYRPTIPTVIFEGATVAQATRIISDNSLTSVDVQTQPTRFYTDPLTSTHFIGYVRGPSEKDVKRFEEFGMVAPEIVGKLGLEYAHDKELVGKPGEQRIEHGLKKGAVGETKTTPATPGDKLVLGLDLDLQRYAVELLGTHTGTVVAIEPSTGLILAYVSLPSYDANPWINGLSKADYAALQNDARLPMINRGIATAYMPGSTFKIVTSLAAYMAGKFETRHTVYCSRGIKLGKKKLGCTGFHQSVSYDRAFTSSCNAYFADLGMRAGPEALRKACYAVGFGERSGVDLYGELKGNVPDNAWLKRVYERGWFRGDTANFAIGQGGITVTPMQLANFLSCIANRGKLLQPHFVRERVSADGTKVKTPAKIIGEFKASADFWNTLEYAMAGVLSRGTARASAVPGFVMGGKTGSAENSRGRLTDSVFVGMAPMKNPKIAIAVIAENAGHGGELAAPIGTRLMARYLKPPAPTPPAQGNLAKNSAGPVGASTLAPR